jgi:hypothetical protein
MKKLSNAKMEGKGFTCPLHVCATCATESSRNPKSAKGILFYDDSLEGKMAVDPLKNKMLDTLLLLLHQKKLFEQKFVLLSIFLFFNRSTAILPSSESSFYQIQQSTFNIFILFYFA